ncbi:hypothetical protein M407DRAFT_19145 [Tulasnella calospora MUT 4182]|uniref:Peptide hydrolase n=1 Tax=Tulasnella calospora MUT 4182 TaxID=1051891 RepID=A0A0C3QSG2_9AGAM|nr:hypothetical protein M407DRAFT_19145 [Tulasnella calospora MUT 4182]
MTFVQRVVDFFSFSTRPVTVLTLATYAVILIASIWIHEGNPHVPQKPSKQLGLDLDAAWNDLQHITTFPHPYNSHANDVVRAYILGRVKAMGKRRESFFHISDDHISNGTYAAGQLIYFEGNNVLVKIDGSDDDADQKGGVLVSAHFDSVSTAPGATDNGMGAATTLSLIDYFAKNQPRRNIIFNLNNGEEDWLNGAHAFLEHPWASLVSVFLNLEGAGNGGRPLLFRTSSTGVTKAFRAVRSPHGTVLSADAFKRRVIRSGTDFEVYNKAGMKGLDLAFYRNRARYHTKYDSVPALEGKGSLWAMMSAGLRATQALDAANDGSEGGGQPVYFDLFGATMVVLEQNTMFILNVVALAVGPAVVAALLVFLRQKRKLVWSTEGWIRFPLASIVAAASTIGLANLYSKFSTYIVYSSSYSVLASLLITFYLVLYAILRTLNWYRPPSGGQPAQRAIVFLQTYFFWWSLLIFDTVVLKVLQVGGLYFIAFYHAGTLAALVISLLEMLWVVKGESATSINGDEHAEEEPRRSGPFGDDEDEIQEEAEASEPTERSSLLPKHADRDEWVIEDHRLATPLWGIEFLLAAGFPIILATQIALLLLTSTSQTLSDGNNPLSVYLMIAISSVLIILPLAPFIHKIHRIFSLVLVFILIITVAYNMLAFPFSMSSPLKVYFQQTVNLDANATEPHSLVELVAVQGYLDRYVVPSTPSGQDAINKGQLTCGPTVGKRVGLWSCRYPGPPPNVAPISANDIGTEFGSSAVKPDLITFNATRLTANTGKITVKGRNTRSCRLYFDDPIKAAHVKGGNDRVQPGYVVPEDGVKEVRLWSRTWDKEFEVLVEWDGKVKKQKVTGRVACEWAEMREGRIPALEEVLGFSPMWTAVTKLEDGLVEAYKKFEM